MVIALPKGRLAEEAERIFLNSGIIERGIPEGTRKLFLDAGNGMKIILLRAWDVPAYVESKTADFGICGKDMLLEQDADVLEVMDLKFGYCKMVIAVKNGISKEELFSKPNLKVATKYPNIARKFFASISVQAEIIKLYGSVELAAITGMSDCVIDLMSTGATLMENGLNVLEVLFESTARLIFNRASFYNNLPFYKSLKEKLKKFTEDA